MPGTDKIPTESLRKTILEMGADLAGFADLRMLPEDIRHGFPRGISIAKRYSPDVIKGIINGPTMEYAIMYEQLNAMLNSLVKRVAVYIEELGYNAKPLRATVITVLGDVPETAFKPLEEILINLPHKTIATSAGLGWIGKTDLLVTEKYGPRQRLASILTDAPFACDEAVVESRCGECVACVDACPVGAGRAEDWRRDAAPEVRYDVRKCYEYTKKVSTELGITHQLCGMCIAACPVGE